jgi:hypothetical protein
VVGCAATEGGVRKELGGAQQGSGSGVQGRKSSESLCAERSDGAS